jgi:hypothetical protein
MFRLLNYSLQDIFLLTLLISLIVPPPLFFFLQFKKSLAFPTVSPKNNPIENIKSDLKEIHAGVPQGSILGLVSFSHAPFGQRARERKTPSQLVVNFKFAFN